MNGTLKSLAQLAAPKVLMQLVCLIYLANGYMPMNVDMVEYFAGAMNVAHIKYTYIHFMFVCALFRSKHVVVDGLLVTLFNYTCIYMPWSCLIT